MNATTSTNDSTDLSEGDRVFVLAKDSDLGRTGNIKDIYDGPHSHTYVVDLDGAGDTHVSRDRLHSHKELNGALNVE